jgi:hypothetical protein
LPGSFGKATELERHLQDSAKSAEMYGLMGM